MTAVAPSIDITSTRVPGLIVDTSSYGRAVQSSPPSRIEPPPSGWISFTTVPVRPITCAEPVLSSLPSWILRTIIGRIAASIAAAVTRPTTICSQSSPGKIAATPAAVNAPAASISSGKSSEASSARASTPAIDSQATQRFSRNQSICHPYPRSGYSVGPSTQPLPIRLPPYERLEGASGVAAVLLGEGERHVEGVAEGFG